MKNSHGFSIIEMMIAITIGLILTGAAIAMFTSTRSSYSTTTGVDQVADDGRFALDFLRNSIRGAGFIGCSTSPTVTNGLSLGSDSMPVNFAQGLMGYEYTGTGSGQSYAMKTPAVDNTAGDWTPTLDSALLNTAPPSGTAGVVAGTDVIVVRSGTGIVNGVEVAPVNVTAIANGASSFTVDSTTGYAAGQLVAISNCAFSTTFQINSIATGNVINHNVMSASAGANSSTAFTYNFGAGAMMSPIDTQIYYIGIGEDGDGALMRLDLNSGTNSGGTVTFQAQELVPDVENMQVLYGYDTQGVQSASEYYTAAGIFPAVLNPNLVMSVKIALLVASPAGAVPKPSSAPVFNMLGTQVTAPQDMRQRQVFDATIALRDALP